MSTQIAALPDAPAATDPVDTFDAKAFAFNAALAAFRTQANAMAMEMQINADVAASLILAMALPQFAGTSTSSVTVGTGTRTFTTQAGKGWLSGQIVVSSSGANYVKGTVTDYTGTDLELNVTSINGSGTYAAWDIGLSYDGLALAGSGDNIDITSLASPAIGAATATTQSATDSSTKVSTTAFVRQFRQLAQIVTTNVTAMATGTNPIPSDNSIPQQTEGDQYMSLAITPKNASSTLEIDVTWIGDSTVSGQLITALFQDSGADALAVGLAYPSSNQVQTITFKYFMTAGTTSATTFKVRAGSAGFTTFNGRNGVALMGGVMASRITIKEILP